MLRKVRISTMMARTMSVESGMDDHITDDVPRHQEFESQVLAANTIGVQSIGLAF